MHTTVQACNEQGLAMAASRGARLTKAPYNITCSCILVAGWVGAVVGQAGGHMEFQLPSHQRCCAILSAAAACRSTLNIFLGPLVPGSIFQWPNVRDLRIEGCNYSDDLPHWGS